MPMLVNRYAVRIEWADCDAAGIVYYPRYFAMFDTATHHLFEAAGWKKRDLISEFDIVGIPMVDTRAKFTAPSSFGVEHKAFKPSESGEHLAIEAWETRVWVGRHPGDATRLKSRPIPRRVI